MHCNKKWAKRSFPLENNPSEEGKSPCGYWNICPATHTVIIHSSVREKCSRIWTGTYYRSKKVNFLELSLTQIFQGNFPHSVFLKDISGKFPHSRGKNVLTGSSWKSIFFKTKDLAILKYWLWSFTALINGNEERKKERKKERRKEGKKERRKERKKERKRERKKERLIFICRAQMMYQFNGRKM